MVEPLKPIGEAFGAIAYELTKDGGEPLIDIDGMRRASRIAAARQKHRAPEKVFYPSSLADPCMRFDVIRWMVASRHPAGEEFAAKLKFNPEAEDYKSNRSFDAGTYLHLMEQEMYFAHGAGVLAAWKCRDCGTKTDDFVLRPTTPCWHCHPGHMDESDEDGLTYWKYAEAHVYHPAGIRGKVDLGVATGAGVVIGDFKWVANEAWDWVTETAPKPKDKTQMQIYLWLANAVQGILIYENMGAPAAPPLIKTINPDPRIGDSVLHYIDMVKKLAEEGRFLVATQACPKNTSARAKRCPLRRHCFPEVK